jgi:hypothetical protein
VEIANDPHGLPPELDTYFLSRHEEDVQDALSRVYLSKNNTPSNDVRDWAIKIAKTNKENTSLNWLAYRILSEKFNQDPVVIQFGVEELRKKNPPEGLERLENYIKRKNRPESLNYREITKHQSHPMLFKCQNFFRQLVGIQ